MNRSIDVGVRTLAWLALLLAGWFLAMQDIRSIDYWWQLRSGAHIAQTGAVPTVDPFTYTAQGARWIDIHWLFQLMLFGIYSAGGHAAVVLAKVATLLALIGLVTASAPGRPRSPLLIVPLGLMAVAVSTRVIARPELVTFLLLAAVCLILDRTRRGPGGWLYLIPFLQLIWVNTHGLYVLGLALLAIHWSAEVVLRLTRQPRPCPDRLRDLSVVLMLSGAAAVLNPNGLEGALYPFQQLLMIGAGGERDLFGTQNSELLPVFGRRRVLSPLAMGVFLLLAALSAGFVFLNRRRAPITDPLILTAFFYLGVSARRNVALFAIVAAMVAMRNAAEYGRHRQLPRGLELGLAAAAAAVLLALSIDVASDRFYPRLAQKRSTGLGVMESHFPIGAVDWIARERPPGRICHHMMDGGYLSWALHPHYRTMVDGRLEIFGPELFRSLMPGSPRRFQRLDARYHFGSVLIHHEQVRWSALSEWLAAERDWRLTYVDDTAAVFVRVRGQTRFQDMPVEQGYGTPDPTRSEGERRRLARRVDVLAGMGEPRLALVQLDAAIDLYPELESGRFNRAVLLMRIGERDAALAQLERLLVQHPHEQTLILRIAAAMRGLGQVERARELEVMAEARSRPTSERRAEPVPSGDDAEANARWRDLIARLGVPIAVALGALGALGLLVYQGGRAPAEDSL